MGLNFDKVDLNTLDSDQETRTTLSEAIKVDPDRQARVNQVSQDTGVPSFAVEPALDEMETDLKFDKVDFNTLSERSPITNKFFTDFNNASIAHDDIDVFSGIENTFKGLAETFSLNFESQGKGALLYGIDRTPDKIQDLIPPSALPMGMEFDAAMLSHEMASNFGIETDAQLQTAKEEGIEGLIDELRTIEERRAELTPENLNLIQKGVRAGVESLVNMAPGVGLTILSGGRALPLLTTIGAQTFTDSYGSGRADGLTPEQARWYATIDATIEVGTEVLPTDKLLEIATGKSGGKVSKELLSFAIREMGGEQLATFGQSLNAMAFDLDEEMANADTIEERINIQLERQAITAIATLVAGGVQAGVAGGISKTVETLTKENETAVQRGLNEQGKLDELNRLSQESSVKERSTDTFKQFVKDAAGDNTHVFVDNAQLSLYLREVGENDDPAVALLRSELQAAQSSGADVAIPVEEFSAVITGTEHYDALRDSMTFSTESIAPFRQETAIKENQDYLRKLAETAQEQSSQYVEAQNIMSDVREQLIDTGQVDPQVASVYSELVSARMVAFAADNGLTVAEAFDQHGVTVEGPQTGKREALSDTQVFNQSEITSTDFISSLTAAREANPNGASVTVFDAADYENMDVYLFDENKAGFAIEHDGTLTAVFKHPDSSMKKALDSMIPLAIQSGATRLDAFEGFLTESYAKHGFKEVDRVPWDDKYAPEGWNKETQGTPDVVYMELSDEGKQAAAETDAKSLPEPSGVRRGVGLLAQQSGQNSENGRAADGSLQGLPRDIEGFTPQHNAEIEAVAKKYAEAAGIPYTPPDNYVKVDPVRAKKIADEFEKMKHDPQNPEVAAAYRALINETTAQYKAVMDSGLTVEFINYAEQGDPYEASPRLAVDDVNNNNHMWVFSTKDGFGNDSTFDPVDNPLLEETEFKDANGTPMLVNDLFRVVHDYFGHAKEGVGFRAAGEENAWRAHSAMFSPEARKALTTETRGQNSWLNYGPHGDTNRTAKTDDTVFADQKIGILPDWVVEEGSGDQNNPDVFNQPDNDPTQHRGYYDPVNSIIRLNESSDLSTFIHEFAHFMYDTELKVNSRHVTAINKWLLSNVEAVANEASTQELNINTAEVTAYLNEGTTGDRAKDDQLTVAGHERFARAFESYVMEGKAPSIELRRAFRKMARWLARVYEHVTGKLNVTLDDNIRAVFDRLIATENQIQVAESRNRIEPLFTDAVVAGMTEKQFAEYQQKSDEASDVASETLRDKLIKEFTRQTQKWWKQEKAEVVQEQREIVGQEKVYRAADVLRTGDMKLDRFATKEMLGEKKTPPKLNKMTITGGEGVHPDQAAAFLGYSSGDEMLRDIIDSPSLSAAVEAKADEIMTNRHGDLLNDGYIERLADDALRNNERAEILLKEYKALTKGTNQARIDRQTFKDIAEETIDKLSYREIHPGKYRNAEIRAAKEAAVAVENNDMQGAARAKARQLMNFYLGRSAQTAKDETLRIVDRTSKYRAKRTREAIAKAEGGFLEQIDKILSRFEFRKSATLKSVNAKNIPVMSWAEDRIQNHGDALIIPAAVADETYVTHWKNVPHRELLSISDTLKNIEHVARYSNKIKQGEEQVEFDELVDSWTDKITDSGPARFKTTIMTAAERRNWGRWTMAQMTKIPWMASWLDNGERTGVSHRVLVQPFTEAYHAELEMWRDIGNPVMTLINDRSKADRKRHNAKIHIPEIGQTLYGHQILAVALNTGNRSNLRKMLLGEQWATNDTEAEISFDNPKLQAILRHMTKDDWVMVQKIWDQMELLYPQLAEVHRRTTGVTPPKVEATTIENEHGTFRGGYYPVKYDAKRSQKASRNQEREQNQLDSMFGVGGGIHASVTAGATNERTGFFDPIKLTLDVVPNHFQETIHYITHHDPVRQVNKIIRDKRVEKAITEKLGPEEYAQLKPWLNDIAKDGRDTPIRLSWDDVLGRLRFGITLGVMGFKASTGIIQLLGASNTIAEVGTKHFYKGVRNVLGSPADIKSSWEFAVSRSKVLDHRTNTMDREIKNAMHRIAGKKGVLAVVQEASMKHIALIQAYMVDLPSWHAAYSKGVAEWGDEARAVQYADWVVENVQGSGATKDLPAILRNQNEAYRQFTMFMTFFSSLWNAQRDLVKGVKSKQYSVSTTAAKAMFMFVLPVYLEMLMRDSFEDDEPEENMEKYLTQLALYPTQSVPFIRDVANGSFGTYGYNLSPLDALLEQSIRSVPGFVEGTLTDAEITKAQVKGTSKITAAGLGIPGINQAWASGEHLYEVLEYGEEFTTHQLLFGPKRDK